MEMKTQPEEPPEGGCSQDWPPYKTRMTEVFESACATRARTEPRLEKYKTLVMQQRVDFVAGEFIAAFQKIELNREAQAY